MTATIHALVGAAIVCRFPHPEGLILAFLSHLPLDYLPHWDPIDSNHKRPLFFNLVVTGLDVVLGLTLVWYIFSRVASPLTLLAGVFSAQLPDWLSAPYFFFDLDLFPSRQIREIQVKYHHKIGLPFGLLIQLAVVILIFVLLDVNPLY